MFNGPIPGESLTEEPGSMPYEQPPQYETVEEVFELYVRKLEEDDFLEQMLFVLDRGAPVDLMVESVLMNGEMNGKHTADASILVGPLLHEHIMSLAEAANIEVVEFQGKSEKEKIQELRSKDTLMAVTDRIPQSEITRETDKVLKPEETKSLGFLNRK